MHRADARDHADVRSCHRAQLGDLADPAHAHLADDDLGVGLDPRQRQRQADLVVVPALGRDGLRVRPAHRGEDVLRRRLAGRAGDPDDAGRAPTPHGAAESGDPGECILRDERRSSPSRERVSGEVLAPVDGKEEVALLDAPRVDLHSCHLLGPGRSIEPAGTERGDLLEAERDHFVAAPSLLRASRATSRSSKGTVRSRNCCPCSWPLPGDDDDVTGLRHLDCLGDRLAPVGHHLDLHFVTQCYLGFRRRSRR